MKKWPWIGVIILVIFIDQLTKHWVLGTLLPYDPKPIVPMMNLTLAFNTGAAFSFLSDAGAWHRWFFLMFSASMSILLIIWLVRTASTAIAQLLALSLIVGGALGNFIDRIIHGHVIDFIDVYYKAYHWPVFNIADSAICLGALLLMIDLLFHPK